MYTDLFLALADERNQPPHAVTAALAYTFCPAAARWWLNGAKPTPVYDPVWHAMQDRSGGATLKDMLLRYDLELLVDDVRSYIAAVEQYRPRVPHIPAPETMPVFPGVTIDPVKRGICSRALQDHFGGDWRNLIEYVRTWAFLIQDWQRGAGLEDGQTNAALQLAQVTLALTLPGSKKPVFFPAWMWTRKKENALRFVIGCFVADVYEQDQLRIGLLMNAGLAGEKALPRIPDLFVLEYRSGRASPPDVRLSVEQLTETIKRLYRIADDGDCPPLGILHGGGRCRYCGYQLICWEGAGIKDPTEIAFNFGRGGSS